MACVRANAATEATPVTLFELRDVRLLDGPFKARRTWTTDTSWRTTRTDYSPVPSRGRLPAKAKPYGNWESMGLDGHTAGHYLSALAMMYASTGDAELKRRLDHMVAELAECQNASGDGYVGGVPNGKALWDDVAAGRLKVTPFA
jgi:DUF1680 family protein